MLLHPSVMNLQGSSVHSEKSLLELELSKCDNTSTYYFSMEYGPYGI